MLKIQKAQKVNSQNSPQINKEERLIYKTQSNCLVNQKLMSSFTKNQLTVLLSRNFGTELFAFDEW